MAGPVFGLDRGCDVAWLVLAGIILSARERSMSLAFAFGQPVIRSALSPCQWAAAPNRLRRWLDKPSKACRLL